MEKIWHGSKMPEFSVKVIFQIYQKQKGQTNNSKYYKISINILKLYNKKPLLIFKTFQTIIKNK